jgi:hypothetical protein
VQPQQSDVLPQATGGQYNQAWRDAEAALQQDWQRFHALQERAQLRQPNQPAHIPSRYETLAAEHQREQMQCQRQRDTNRQEAQMAEQQQQLEWHRRAEEECQQRHEVEAQAHHLQQLEQNRRDEDDHQAQNNMEQAAFD